MSILQQVPKKMQTILETVPDAAALETEFVRRKRKLTGSAMVQTLVFGWLETPEASYQHLAETAALLDIQVSRQALAQRLTAKTAEMLKITLEAALAELIGVSAEPQALALLEGFTGVFVQDSTSITLPDALHETWRGQPKKNHPKKAGMKLHLRFDVLTGGFQAFELTDGLAADSTTAKTFETLPPGSLHLADLAYFSLDELEKLTQTGIYWITRLKANVYLSDETGGPLDLQKMLNATENTFIRKAVRIGKTKKLHGHLIAEHLSEAETEKRRRNIRYRARRKCQTPSKTRLRLAGYNLYITNIEEHLLTPKQIATLVRIRWQIELMFKNFKSLAKLHVSRSQKPYRILSEVYAKLIALLIKHAIAVGAGWRCIQHTILKTSRFLAGYARTLTVSFHQSTDALLKTLTDIKRAFENVGFLEKGSGKNTTFRRIQDATENP